MLSATKMLAGYAAKTTSPVQVVQAALTAITADNPLYNAWVHVAAEQALAQAQASAARWAKNAPLGPLDGVPVGVKDLLAVAGQPMRRGSQSLAPDFMPAEDAPLVARLREAGAILIGKTATPDSGCKLDTASIVHGITRNPFDKSLTAGGSSGGAAVSLALGHVPLSIGTDGGGSIRIPAAYCGVFGLKPSAGRIPGLLGPFWPHSVAGPMSRNVADTALAWNVVTLPDIRDPYALQNPPIDWPAQARGSVAGLRIALAPSFNGIGTTLALSDTLHKAAALLQSAGAIITLAEPAWPCDAHATFITLWRAMYAQSVSMMPPAQAARIDPLIKTIIAASANITRADFQSAIQNRDLLALAMADFHTKHDLLLCPVMPCQPWPAGRATPAPIAEDDWSWCPFTYPFNMTRQPAASVPMGTDSKGIPRAVQLVAAIGNEAAILRASQTLMGATES